MLDDSHLFTRLPGAVASFVFLSPLSSLLLPFIYPWGNSTAFDFGNDLEISTSQSDQHSRFLFATKQYKYRTVYNAFCRAKRCHLIASNWRFISTVAVMIIFMRSTIQVVIHRFHSSWYRLTYLTKLRSGRHSTNPFSMHPLSARCSIFKPNTAFMMVLPVPCWEHVCNQCDVQKS